MRWSYTQTSTGTGWSTTTSGSPWWPPSRMWPGRNVQLFCTVWLLFLFAAELFSQKGFQSLMKFRWINLFVECSKMFSWSYGIHFSWNGSKLVYPKIYNELYSQEQHPWKEYLYRRIVAKVTHRRFYLFFSIYLKGNVIPLLGRTFIILNWNSG